MTMRGWITDSSRLAGVGRKVAQKTVSISRGKTNDTSYRRIYADKYDEQARIPPTIEMH